MELSWSRTTRYIIVIAIIGVLAAVVLASRALVNSIIIAALLAYVLNPAAQLLGVRTRLSRNASVLVVYLCFLTALIAIPAVATPVIVRQVRGFTLDLQRVQSELEGLLARPLLVAGLTLRPGVWVANLEQLLAEAAAPVAGGALDLIGEVTTNLAWVLVIAVSTYYLLKDGPRLAGKLVDLTPPAWQSDVKRLLDETDRVWSAYLRGQLTLSLIVGILTAIAAAAVGLRGAIVIGVVAGVLDVVPSLGPIVAGIISLIVAAFVGSTYLPLSNALFGLVVLGLFFVIQQVENIWLRPQIMGHALRLHPGLVFVGVLGALALVGVLGALIIIPLMATLSIVGRYVYCRLLDRDPWPEDAATAPRERAHDESRAPVTAPRP